MARKSAPRASPRLHGPVGHPVEPPGGPTITLEGDAAALAALRTEGRRITSVLTVAEAMRAVIGARAPGRMTAQEEQAATRAIQAFARRCDLVEVTDAILGRGLPNSSPS